MKGGLNADTAASSKRTKTMKGGLNADTAQNDDQEMAWLVAAAMSRSSGDGA